MACADVVAVPLLQDFEVTDHLRLGDGMAHVRPMLVPVRALELDGRAIDLEDASVDLDFTETDPGGEEFAGHTQHECLQVGRLGGPLGGIGNRQLHGNHCLFTRLQGWHSDIRLAGQGDRQSLRGTGRVAIVPHLRRHFHGSVLVVLVEVSLDEEVADVDGRRAPERDIAEDARQPPHVLVLQETAGTEPVDLNGNHVPDEERRVDPVEREEHVPAVPVRRHREFTPVAPDRVALVEGGPVRGRLTHDMREILLEDIARVFVIWRAVAEHLPV